MAASMCRRIFFPLTRKSQVFSRRNASFPTEFTYCTVASSAEQHLEKSEAKYPPILPVLFGRQRKSKEAQAYRTQLAIQSMNEKPTPTEMIYDLSKRQSWHYMIRPMCFHYSFLDLYKHSMKTVMVNELPEHIKILADSSDVEQAAERLRPHIVDCILQEQLYSYRHKGDRVKRDRVVGKQIIENIMRTLLTGLAGDFPHLMDAQIDQDVQVKSFWKRVNTEFQFEGDPLFLIRTKYPLQEFISKDNELSIGEVPSWSYGPENVSVFKQHINSVCFPGFKIGNPYTSGHTQVYMTTMKREKCVKDKTLEEVLQGFGLSTSFGWLNGLAMYNMYNPYRDVNRPMTCQTIVTDGTQFSFFCYQLNTLGLCDLSAGNPLRNVCWYTPDLKLYGDINEGSVRDINMDVLKLLVAFFLNPTVPLEV